MSITEANQVHEAPAAPDAELLTTNKKSAAQRLEEILVCLLISCMLLGVALVIIQRFNGRTALEKMAINVSAWSGNIDTQAAVAPAENSPDLPADDNCAKASQVQHAQVDANLKLCRSTLRQQ